MLILPDDVPVDAALGQKLREYLDCGGRLVPNGEGVIDPEQGMLFDVGGEVGEPSPFQPDYVLPREDLRPDFVGRPMVMYARARRLQVTDGDPLGEVCASAVADGGL